MRQGFQPLSECRTVGKYQPTGFERTYCLTTGQTLNSISFSCSSISTNDRLPKDCSQLNNSEGDKSAFCSNCSIETEFASRLRRQITFFFNSDKRFICGYNVAANSYSKNSLSYFKNSATLPRNIS